MVSFLCLAFCLSPSSVKMEIISWVTYLVCKLKPIWDGLQISILGFLKINSWYAGKIPQIHFGQVQKSCKIYFIYLIIENNNKINLLTRKLEFKFIMKMR